MSEVDQLLTVLFYSTRVDKGVHMKATERGEEGDGGRNEESERKRKARQAWRNENDTRHTIRFLHCGTIAAGLGRVSAAFVTA